MQFIDTHTHLYSSQFDEDRHQVVQRAIDAGITKLLLPNVDLDSIDGMHQLVADFPQNCFPMLGLHPCSVDENWENELNQLYQYADQHAYCAIGEIGIDLYWDKTTLSYQQKAFAKQIEWAKQKQLPIAIHVREAFNETFEILDQLNHENLTGVFHCFTGTIEQAEKIIGYGGFKLGIGGVVTFKNSGLDQVLSSVDLKHLMLETDAPYLAPMPHRGKRNESQYITLIASKLASIKNCSIETIAAITSQNARDLFKTVQ